MTNKEKNRKISCYPFGKKGQEEMVGFGLIVVIVMVIIIILFAIIMYKSDSSGGVESYQVESFVSTILTYTTNCTESYQDHLSLQKLISRCIDNKKCDNGEDTCDLLENILTQVINESWDTNSRPTKGYSFRIISDSKDTLIIENGESLNGSFRTAVQDLTISGKDLTVILDIYG